MKKQALT